jgi:hypothetical protein
MAPALIPKHGDVTETHQIPVPTPTFTREAVSLISSTTLGAVSVSLVSYLSRWGCRMKKTLLLCFIHGFKAG